MHLLEYNTKGPLLRPRFSFHIFSRQPLSAFARRLGFEIKQPVLYFIPLSADGEVHASILRRLHSERDETKRAKFGSPMLWWVTFQV